MKALNIKWLAIAALSILILYGLGAGLMYSLNYDLTSDTVVPGLVTSQIFQHGSLAYEFPVNDPYLFTDIYTFHLLPQLLSGYNPAVVRLTAFAMFIILIAVFSYIIYRYAGVVSALMFAALMANLSPDAYFYYISPEWHVGTLIAVGVFMILLDFDRVKKSSIYWSLGCSAIVGLVMLSDSLMLALFIVPYIAYYLLFERAKAWKGGPVKKTGKKTSPNRKIGQKTDLAVLSVAVLPGIAWLFKTLEPISFSNFMPYFVPTPVGAVDISHALATNLPLFFQCVAYLANQGIYNILTLQVGILDILLAIIFLAALGIAVLRYNKKARYPYAMFAGATIAVFLGFVFLDLTQDGGISSSRFVIFTALAIFAAMALGYDETREKDKLNLLLLGLVLVLALSTVPLNYARITALDGHPNQAQYDLITYLENKGYTIGYSDYDNSNVLTYLSGQQVTVRALHFQNGVLNSYQWLGVFDWYKDQPTKFFYMTKNGTEFDRDMAAWIATRSPQPQEDTYAGYRFYFYDM